MRKVLLVVVSAVVISSLSYAESTCRCMPDEPCWPDKTAWRQLQLILTGTLIESQTKKLLHNPFQIENNPADTQSQGWMHAWQSMPSRYVVAAANADDVAAAINFARDHHLRIVVKGTGHDYLGRSSAPNSLMIWTHNMRDITYDNSFVPSGCNQNIKSVPALTVGAGTRWLEAYDAAVNKHNRYVQGGGCTTVGAAGGFIQGGGFGSFSKMFGTGAAGMLQAEIVTADGKKRIANQCQNKDLFWAIRGGGASTFGVVTQVTLRTHTMPANFGLLRGTIKAKDNASYKKLIKEVINLYYKNMNNEHWGEQIKFDADNTVTFGLTFVNLNEAQVSSVFSPLSKWLSQHKDDYQANMQPVIIPANKLWDYKYMQKTHPELVTLNKAQDAAANQFWWTPNSSEVSAYWYTYQSWWLPLVLFDADHAPQLTDALYAASRLAPATLHFNKGLAGASAQTINDVKETAMNPSVTDAAALLIMGARTTSKPDLTKGKSIAANISKAMSSFIKLAPNAGSYINETDYFLPNWQQAFWRNHYTKLKTIKHKYDPQGLFYCHHCVGSEDWSEDGVCRK